MNKLKNVSVGDMVLITTANDLYEGEVLEITGKKITMNYFNSVKGEVREVTIMLNKIEKVEDGD